MKVLFCIGLNIPNVCRMLCYEGLDLKHEITAVNTQRLGDTVLLSDRNNDDAISLTTMNEKTLIKYNL